MDGIISGGHIDNKMLKLKDSVTLICVSHTKEQHIPLVLSVLDKLSLVNELIIVKPDDTEKIFRYKHNGIDIVNLHIKSYSPWYNHSVGLHKGLGVAKNNYIMFADPDSFYINDCSVIYQNLIKDYKINFVGAQHYLVIEQAFLEFPTVISMMTKKEFLPPEDWMSGEIRMLDTPYNPRDWQNAPRWDGFFLFPMPNFSYAREYPNNIRFDIGCMLYLWVKQNKYKWLSFGSKNNRLYWKDIVAADGIDPDVLKFNHEPLLFHQTSNFPDMKEDIFDIYAKAMSGDLDYLDGYFPDEILG